MLRQMGPMIQQIQQACDECQGAGEIINAKDRCKECLGKKVMSEKKMLEVHIDKGMKGGQTITFRGESDQAPGVTPGDVVIVIEEKPNDRFKRRDTDLFTKAEVDLLTALAGGQFAFKHLDDRALIVKVHPGEVLQHSELLFISFVASQYTNVFPDALKVIPGEGMPSQRHHEPGDLYIRVQVKFPDSMPLESVPLLEKALPPRRPLVQFPKNIMLEEVEVVEADARQHELADAGEAMDEDYDGDGEPRVQCANQ